MLQLPEKVPFFKKLIKTSKKLVSILATSVLLTDSGEKVVRVPYIYYLIWFQKDQEQVRALLNSGSEVYAMKPALAQKLLLHIQKTNIGAQKIGGSIFKILKMVIANF